MHHYPANSDMGFKTGRALCNKRVPMAGLEKGHNVDCQECRAELERRIANDEQVVAGLKAGAAGFVSGDDALDARLLASAERHVTALRLALVEF